MSTTEELRSMAVSVGMEIPQAATLMMGAADSIGGLEAENERLRDELAKWERLTANIELPEYPVAQFKPKDLERENAKLRELLKYNGAVIEACTSEILDHVGVPYIVGPAGVAQALMEATAMLVHKRYDFDPPSFYKEDK